MFTPLEQPNFLIKIVSIYSAADIICLESTPLVIVGYSHLTHMPTFETNYLIININGTTKQPCKTKHI